MSRNEQHLSTDDLTSDFLLKLTAGFMERQKRLPGVDVEALSAAVKPAPEYAVSTIPSGKSGVREIG